LPKGPKGEKRPADVIGNAVKVMRIAVGEEIEEPDSRNPNAVALGRLGGSKGGAARSQKLSDRKKKTIARNAANKRWGNSP
jgi:hypothetical protein